MKEPLQRIGYNTRDGLFRAIGRSVRNISKDGRADGVQRHRYAVAHALLDRYRREGDALFGKIVAMDETWARSYEPNLKRQSNVWKDPGSPHPKKMRPTQCTVKVMFIVTYGIE